MADKIWLKHARTGEVKQVEHTTEVVVPLLVQGYAQCEPPAEENKPEDNQPKEG